MELEAERVELESARQSLFERRRHATSWLAAAVVIVGLAVALVGMPGGSPYVDQQAAVAVSPGDFDESGTSDPAGARAGPGPTVLETPPAQDSGPAPQPTRTTDGEDAPTGAAASSSVPTTAVTSPGVTTRPSDAGSAPGIDERGRWALDRIDYSWTEKLPGWTIEFHEGRDGLLGLTMVDDKRIEIYVRDDQSDDLLVHILAHEIGHAVDVTLNTGDDRRRWQAIRGIQDEPWWPDSAASDFKTGAGDFAEGFAYWQSRSGNHRSKLGPAPNEAQLEVIAELSAG